MDGKKLRLFMEKHDISKRTLAKEMHISHQWLSQIELKEKHLSEKMKLKLILAIEALLEERIQEAERASKAFSMRKSSIFDMEEAQHNEL